MSNSREWDRLTNEQKSLIKKHQFQCPIKLGEIATELGLVVKLATLPANISGEIKEENGRVTIRINRHDVKARQRYTLSHEIAHFLLHRHLLREGITDDVLYRSAQSNEIEAEANRLAADIIMPMNHVDAFYQLHYKGKKDAILYESIADSIGVSVIALKYRLGVS
ncbi:ImmA/IrrE family metallo-endopeptidase [Pectobacterium brasiliense]|uniref:ImmA/IrrE family metallo-endopeptidase n=1 Tax=Pectobacterium brasiliense TaxID=180957 RepID=UPI0040448802